MDSLTIVLPDELRDFVEAQVADGKYKSASEYMQSLVREAQKREAKAALEAKLLEGLRSPAREMTAEDWSNLKQQVLDREALRQTG